MTTPSEGRGSTRTWLTGKPAPTTPQRVPSACLHHKRGASPTTESLPCPPAPCKQNANFHSVCLTVGLWSTSSLAFQLINNNNNHFHGTWILSSEPHQNRNINNLQKIDHSSHLKQVYQHSREINSAGPFRNPKGPNITGVSWSEGPNVFPKPMTTTRSN